MELFPPYNFINYSSITLNQLYNLGTNIFIYIVWNNQAIISVLYHFYSCLYCLQHLICRDSRKDKITFVQCFGSFGAGTDTYSRKCISYRTKETALLRQCS